MVMLTEKLEVSPALAGRLTPASEDREQLIGRHRERAQQCCLDLLRLTDAAAPSTRVLMAYLVLLHDALAVLAFWGWRVAPSSDHADVEVLDVLMSADGVGPHLAHGVYQVVAARKAELEGSLATDGQARSMQVTALDVHRLLESRWSLSPSLYGGVARHGGLAATEAMPKLPFEMEGEVVEVFDLAGLAHVVAEGEVVYGVTRRTPGINFDSLRVGQKLRCHVTHDHRVLHATIV